MTRDALLARIVELLALKATVAWLAPHRPATSNQIDRELQKLREKVDETPAVRR